VSAHGNATTTLAPIDPAKSQSVIPLRVRFFETDLMGIVHHAAYLTYFEAGRVEWLRRRGVTYAEWANKGVHLPVVEAHLNYRAPSRFDDELEVKTTLAELRTVSLRFTYEITKDGEPIADGMTRLGCIDASHKLLRIPEYMREVMLAGEK
jgi:acyl-CoA thioester hydrolase